MDMHPPKLTKRYGVLMNLEHGSHWSLMVQADTEKELQAAYLEVINTYSAKLDQLMVVQRIEVVISFYPDSER